MIRSQQRRGCKGTQIQKENGAKTGAILTVVSLKQTAFTQWPANKVTEELRAIAPSATKQVRIKTRNKELKRLMKGTSFVSDFLFCLT